MRCSRRRGVRDGWSGGGSRSAGRWSVRRPTNGGRVVRRSRGLCGRCAGSCLGRVTSGGGGRCRNALSAWGLAGRHRRGPRRDRMRGTARSMDLRAWLSCRFAAGTPIASGSPARSVTTWIFEPGLPRSTGFGPVRSPLFRPDRGGVQDRPRPDPRRSTAPNFGTGWTGWTGWTTSLPIALPSLWVAVTKW